MILFPLLGIALNIISVILKKQWHHLEYLKYNKLFTVSLLFIPFSGVSFLFLWMFAVPFLLILLIVLFIFSAVTLVKANNKKSLTVLMLSNPSLHYFIMLVFLVYFLDVNKT